MKILLANDDPDLLLVAGLSLETLGKHQVKKVLGSDNLLGAIAQDPPDLIIMDYYMPSTNGHEVLSQLNVIGLGHLPVIFLTEQSHIERTDEFIKQGACGVIVKPFDPLDLNRRIQSILSNNHAP